MAVCLLSALFGSGCCTTSWQEIVRERFPEYVLLRSPQTNLTGFRVISWKSGREGAPTWWDDVGEGETATIGTALDFAYEEDHLHELEGETTVPVPCCGEVVARLKSSGVGMYRLTLRQVTTVRCDRPTGLVREAKRHVIENRDIYEDVVRERHALGLVVGWLRVGRFTYEFFRGDSIGGGVELPLEHLVVAGAKTEGQWKRTEGGKLSFESPRSPLVIGMCISPVPLTPREEKGIRAAWELRDAEDELSSWQTLEKAVAEPPRPFPMVVLPRPPERFLASRIEAAEAVRDLWNPEVERAVETARVVLRQTSPR